MKLSAHLAAAALLASLTGCSQPRSDEVYAKSLAQAAAELAATPIPLDVGNAFSGAATTVARTGNIIKWHFGRPGHGALVTATLIAEDSTHIRVKVDSKLEDPDSVSSLYLSTPYVGGMVRAAMTEQITAELRDRELDKAGYNQQLSAYIAAHPEEAQKFGTSLKANFDSVDRRMKEDMASEAADAARQAAASASAPTALESSHDAASDASIGNGAPKSEATRPATDLSAYR